MTQRDRATETGERTADEHPRGATVEGAGTTADDRAADSTCGGGVSRRGALAALGLTGLLGLGVTTASADPQGQVGTQSDPVATLYATSVESPTESLALTVDGDDPLRLSNDGAYTDVILGANSNGTGSNASSGATVGGGNNNVAKGDRATIGGGVNNDVDGDYATVAGGYGNKALARFATIAGGGSIDENVVYDEWGTIGGGNKNRAGSDDGDTTSASFATVSGGVSNAANAARASVGGGSSNTASDLNATVGGGFNNTASGASATVAGGYENDADGNNGAIAGGWGNALSGKYAAIGGGENNVAGGESAAVPGGASNTADGDYSVAMGRRANAAHDGSILFGDSTDTFLGSQGEDELRSQMPMYAPAFNTVSARSAKTAVEPVDPERVLEDVASLDVTTWEFTHTDDGRHMGPMAGDFHDTFGLGSDEGSIPTVDADGVAFAAIQGLVERHDETVDRVEETADRVEATDDRLDATQAAFAETEKRVDANRDRLAETDERIAALEAENEALREELTALRAEVEFLANAVVADGAEPSAAASAAGRAPKDAEESG